jgi:hypothetical protein
LSFVSIASERPEEAERFAATRREMYDSIGRLSDLHLKLVICQSRQLLRIFRLVKYPLRQSTMSETSTRAQFLESVRVTLPANNNGPD